MYYMHAIDGGHYNAYYCLFIVRNIEMKYIESKIKAFWRLIFRRLYKGLLHNSCHKVIIQLKVPTICVSKANFFFFNPRWFACIILFWRLWKCSELHWYGLVSLAWRIVFNTKGVFFFLPKKETAQHWRYHF